MQGCLKALHAKSQLMGQAQDFSSNIHQMLACSLSNCGSYKDEFPLILCQAQKQKQRQNAWRSMGMRCKDQSLGHSGH